jgi:hypothetical protein
MLTHSMSEGHFVVYKAHSGDLACTFAHANIIATHLPFAKAVCRMSHGGQNQPNPLQVCLCSHPLAHARTRGIL